MNIDKNSFFLSNSLMRGLCMKIEKKLKKKKKKKKVVPVS